MATKTRRQTLVTPPRSKGGETERITINLGPVDLGQIDLLVEEGFYSNQTDLIRTAIRNQLAFHAQTVHDTVSRRALALGLQHFSRQDLELVRDAKQRLNIHVLGLASIAARCHARARTCHDRFGRGAGRIPRFTRGQGGAG
jgi:Arc/MetJ-type ribon-helix-helix transcriptional regulator